MMVEAECQKRFFKVPQEVLEDSGDDVDIVHLAEHRDGLTAEKLLLQLLHLTISTRQTVQTGLKGETALHLQTLLVCLSVFERVLGNPHLMQAPFFYLIYTVDHKGRNHGCRAGDIVCQYTLHTERLSSFPVLHMEKI